MPRGTCGTGRKRGSSQPHRTYSSEENSAWSNRPYGCHDLKEALRIYRQRQIVSAAPENSWLHVEKHRPLPSYPEWCYAHEHPLKTGRRDGKTMYHRSDVVGPILDSLRDLHERDTEDAFGLVAYIANKRQKTRKEERTPLNSGRKSTGTFHAFTCRGCGSHDRGKLTLGHEGWTCECGVWAGTQIVGGNRQKLGAAEADDKTITADKPWESKTDKYDHAPESAREARAGRIARAKGSGLGGKRAGQHLGRLCDVQSMQEREAAKSIVEAEVAAGVALMPRDRVKQRSVLTHIEEMFKVLHPVDHAVKRVVRMTADSTYISAVQHACRCCRRDLCEVRLAERHAAAIAQACFEHSIEKLCETDGATADLAIDMQRLRDLRDRMGRSSCFVGRTSATQIASSKLMVALINSPDFDFAKPCEPSETDMPVMPSNFVNMAGPPIVSSLNGCKRPSSLRPLASPCFQRSMSICSNGEASPSPSKQIEWRNAIGAIFIAHRAELAVAVRESALRVIQVPSFIKACEAEPKVSGLNDNQLAFCLLNAVAMEQSAADAASLAKSLRPNAGIADKLDLGLILADEAIDCIRSVIPTDAASDKSEREADDLFQ